MSKFDRLPPIEQRYKDLAYMADGSLRWTAQNATQTRSLDQPAGYLCSTSGYWRIKICSVAHALHRVIYEMHHGSIPEDMDVDHIDNNKSNNRIENLQLLTRAENVLKNMRGGTHVNPEKAVIGTCTKTGNVVQFRSTSEAGRNGFTQANVSQCLRGQRRVCKGYTWRYAENKEELSCAS